MTVIMGLVTGKRIRNNMITYKRAEIRIIAITTKNPRVIRELKTNGNGGLENTQ